MLAGLLLNLPSFAPGQDAEGERRYWELLRQRKERELARRKAEFREAEVAKKVRLAEQAFQAVKSARPEAAEQIVAPYRVNLNEKRYQVDWTLLIDQIAAYECLCELMAQIEEEDLLIMLLSDE